VQLIPLEIDRATHYAISLHIDHFQNRQFDGAGDQVAADLYYEALIK
jgi:hypothetical protein